MLKQKVQVRCSSNDHSFIIFGKVLRSDPDAEFHLYLVVEGHEPKRITREYLNGRNRVCFENLDPGTKYIIAAFGDKTAGVATTHNVEVVAPFKAVIDTPLDHSKDFMKIDLPANVPVTPDLARAIKASLR